MRLYLINPNNPLVSLANTAESRWNRYRVWKPLGLLVLAGLTPPGWEITVIDENLGVPDYAAMPRPDLVGITAFTSQASRAYDVAGQFRDLGVSVVMGGIHATMCTEEALGYVDSVVTGEAESAWATVLADARRGRLKRTYTGEHADLECTLVVHKTVLEGNVGPQGASCSAELDMINHSDPESSSGEHTLGRLASEHGDPAVDPDTHLPGRFRSRRVETLKSAGGQHQRSQRQGCQSVNACSCSHFNLQLDKAPRPFAERSWLSLDGNPQTLSHATCGMTKMCWPMGRLHASPLRRDSASRRGAGSSVSCRSSSSYRPNPFL